MRLSDNWVRVPGPGQNDAVSGTSTSSDGTLATLWVPWGTRDYIRSPPYRKMLRDTTLRSFQTPKEVFRRRARRAPSADPLNPTTEPPERQPMPTPKKKLNDLVSCIREGASKPGSPPKGGNMILDHSGNWVHIRTAVQSAKRAGEEISPGWRAMLRMSLSAEAKKRVLNLAHDRSGKTTRHTPRPRQWHPTSKKSDEIRKSLGSRSKLRVSVEKGTGIRQDHHRAERPESGGGSTSVEDGGERPESRRRASAGPRTRAFRPKLKIRDPPVTDAAARQGASAAGKLAPVATCEKGPVRSPDEGGFKSKSGSRRIMGRPKATTEGFELWSALLNAGHEPEGSAHRRQGPRSDEPALPVGPAQPRKRRFQKPSYDRVTLDQGGPVSRGNGRPPEDCGSGNSEPGASGSQERSPDTREAGQRARSPLPPADADLDSVRTKKTKGAYKEKRIGNFPRFNGGEIDHPATSGASQLS